MGESLSAFCHRENLTALLAQWDGQANLPLTPETIPYGSTRKVWWRCEKGHEWCVSVQSRTLDGTGCPVYAGRVILPGENDMASQFPEVAREWHPTLNGVLTPHMVTAGSHKKVWWSCAAGHVWKAAIYSRAGKQKRSCPVCAGVVSGKRLIRYEKMLEGVKEVMQA